MTDESAKAAYEAFAPIYDDFNHLNDYEAWFGLLLPELEKRGLRKGREEIRRRGRLAEADARDLPVYGEFELVWALNERRQLPDRGWGPGAGLECLAVLGQHDVDGVVMLGEPPEEMRDHKVIYIARVDSAAPRSS